MCNKAPLTKEQAISAITTIRYLRRKKGSKKRMECRHYFCRECDAFHLTSMKKQKYYVKTSRHNI